MNTITVNFIACSPAPANGYNVLWRVAGSSSAYTDAGNFVVSPAVFTEGTNPDGTDYEGIIRSDCSESGIDNFGTPVAWSTITDSGIQNYRLSAAFNFSIDDVSGTGAPVVPPTGVNGLQTAHQFGMTGNFNVTISGTLVFTTKIDLYKNGILVDCKPVSGAGVYNLGPLNALEADDVLFSIDSGIC